MTGAPSRLVRPRPERIDRLVTVQAHCSALDALAAWTFLISARRLARLPGDTGEWQTCLVVAAVLAVVTAAAPWLIPRFTINLQRLFGTATLVIATIGIVGSIWVVSLWAMLGLQLVGTALVLAEVGLQRRALFWMWMCAAVLVAAVLTYHGLVNLQPRPE